ncbi:MAG TPA: hypothetical protein P5084_08175, partial [Paludibacter sp.]|nr:hypothetical protein [Paludibacter sp.]
MKKLLFKTALIVIISVLNVLTTIAQITPALQSEVNVYPTNPTAKDSVYVVFSYVSNDGCPDFYLVIDSVSNNNIYVSKKGIESDRACTAVISKFAAKINIGTIDSNTRIYFEGKLINTITPRCIMDKTGVVVAGTKACEGRLFIQEYSPLTVIRFYAFENKANSTTDNTLSGLKVGDKVKFGGYLIKNDSIAQLCNIVGFAGCWEKVIETVPCEMDRKGEVTEVTEKSSIVKDIATQELFEINVKLVVGSILQFKGVKVEC